MKDALTVLIYVISGVIAAPIALAVLFLIGGSIIAAVIFAQERIDEKKRKRGAK